MPNRTLDTDYLVVGSGAAAMAFTDSLIQESGAQVVMVDRRAAPGGHWNDAYAFVRLHQPSYYYGVNSLPLGNDAIETNGPEAGMYERATGLQIRAYYERVMSTRLIPSGQVRFFPHCEYAGESRFVSRMSGETFEVNVRKKIVDGTYLSPAVPATSSPDFELDAGISCLPVHQLVQLSHAPQKFVIIGAGKTAADTCIWLLQNGVDPGAIRWIKPRETWMLNRSYAQPGELVAGLIQGMALQMEAAAQATSVEDLFDRLEASEQLRRVDGRVRPSMFKGATIADWELALLRQVEDVVRLGHVRRIERDQIVLEQGTIPTRPNYLHIHCAANGLPRPPALAIFGSDRITLQPIRTGLVPFNAALVAFVEAHRDDDAEKNRLCPPNPFPDVPLDWARGLLIQLAADRAWSKEADISEWLERSRLNASNGRRARSSDLALQQATQRFAQSARAGITGLMQLASGSHG